MGARSEQLGRSTPDFHFPERGSGPGVQRPPASALERSFGGCQDGGDAHDLTQSKTPRGKCWYSNRTILRINNRQSRREAQSTGLLGVPHSCSTSQRGPPKRLVPSRPSWHPSPLSTQNIRFVLTLCSRSFSDNHISRTLLPSRARSKYFSHASLRSRSISRSPQAMRRKRYFVKGY